ncbi:MAG TPA: hypothetical protein VG735_11725 [Caulobacterales bacterium]|nr:hypothetical protein [Caulobacterales bacterium]
MNNIYVHDLKALLRLAGLEAKLVEEEKTRKQFAANWLIASQWTEGSRYEMIDDFRAKEMVLAVADPANGVFPWLKQNW